MKKALVLLCALALLAAGHARAQVALRGAIKRLPVKVEPFAELYVSAGFNAFYTPSSDGAVEVTLEGPEELLQHTDVLCEGGRLSISTRLEPRLLTRFNLFITAPGLRHVELIGDGDFQVMRPWATPRLELRCQGAVAVRAELRVDTLSAQWAGTGRWLLTGRAGQQQLSLSGATDLDAGGLDGQRIELRAVGAGNIALGSCDSLHTSVAGPLNVTHRGAPLRLGRVNSAPK